jgi:hypothetical protein
LNHSTGTATREQAEGWTSGSPTRADGAASRQCDVSATSSPPPSAVPWSAATTGVSNASYASSTSLRPSSDIFDGSAN